MPAYEFECQACRARFEIVASMQERDRLKLDPPPCPMCRATETRQRFLPFNFSPPSIPR